MSLSFAGTASAGSVNASALESGHSYDQLIVRFYPESNEGRDASARQRVLDAAGNGVGIRQLRRLAVGADVIKLDRKLGAAATEQLMQRIASNPRVEYVELDALRMPLLTPNDSLYVTNQWHYFESVGGINLPAAWDQATGSGVVVAVIDTGITPHSDLNANLVAGYDFITDLTIAADGNGRDADPNDPGDSTVDGACGAGWIGRNSSWHGTHVAGTVAAVTNNATGVAGVAFNAKVSPVRVLGKCGGYTSDIADAIIWASGGTVASIPANANPAEVINMSLGGSGPCDATSQLAINAAVAAGTVVVVAAGNNNDDASGHSPANCLNVITVGATGRTGARSSYSNFGANVDVAAPGGDGGDSVASTLNAGTTVQAAESYAGYQGTSMASPHVAGTVALMQSLVAHTPDQVETILKNTARTLPVPCSLGCGSGIIDASLAISGAVSPIITVTDVIISEGDAGTKLATFTVRLSQPAFATIMFDIGTADGTATAGSDYVASSLTGQTIAIGETSKTFSVTINGDATVEADETFFVNLTNVSGATLADGQGLGKLLNDEVPALVNDVAVTGLSGATASQAFYVLNVPAGATGLTFTITGSGDADLYVKRGAAPTTSVYDCRPYTSSSNESCVITAPGVLATAGSYYVMLNGYAAYSGLSLVGHYSRGLSVGNAAISEGNSGTKLLTFTVNLSLASTGPVTYDIATANGTATAGSDYVSNSLVGQSIAAGATSKSYAVTINGDTTIEANEVLSAVASNLVGAEVLDATGSGTIINDDGLPALSIGDIAIAEGNSGTKVATFTVSLSQASASAVTYNIATYNSTAAAPSDYVAKTLSGETIPAGQTSKTFTVTINGDLLTEPNENFLVNIAGASGAIIADSQAVGTITNDDGRTLSIDNVSVTEGNSGTTVATFTVNLSAASSSAVTYNISTSNNTAASPSDYVTSSLVGQSIAAGLTSKTFSVTINGDTLGETNETFFVNLGGAVGATIADNQGVGTILNDDGSKLSIADVSISEGNSGTKVATFTVTLSPAAVTTVTYNIATANSTAAAPSDYVATSAVGQSIAAGVTSKTFAVTINGDTGVEANEVFTVNLGGAVGASILDGQALGTITNDD